MTSKVLLEEHSEEITLVNSFSIKHLLHDSIATLWETGNQLFRKGQYGDAIEKYFQALTRLEKGEVLDLFLNVTYQTHYPFDSHRMRLLRFILCIRTSKRIISTLDTIQCSLFNIICTCDFIFTEKSDQVVNRSLLHSNRATCHLKTSEEVTLTKPVFLYSTIATLREAETVTPLKRLRNAEKVVRPKCYSRVVYLSLESCTGGFLPTAP